MHEVAPWGAEELQERLAVEDPKVGRYAWSATVGGSCW